MKGEELMCENNAARCATKTNGSPECAPSTYSLARAYHWAAICGAWINMHRKRLFTDRWRAVRRRENKCRTRAVHVVNLCTRNALNTRSALVRDFRSAATDFTTALALGGCAFQPGRNLTHMAVETFKLIGLSFCWNFAIKLFGKCFGAVTSSKKSSSYSCC